jgi:large subunit ribosomal protein L1
MTTGKRFAATESKIDKKKAYSVTEAVALIKGSAPAKFDETVELHFNLGIDPKMGDQQIRGTLTSLVRKKPLKLSPRPVKLNSTSP